MLSASWYRDTAHARDNAVIKIDPTAATVTIDQRGIVRVDEIAVFGMVLCDGEWWVIVQDRNRQRSRVRGTNQVRVPLDVLVAKLMKRNERKGKGRQ